MKALVSTGTNVNYMSLRSRRKAKRHKLTAIGKVSHVLEMYVSEKRRYVIVDGSHEIQKGPFMCRG